MARTGARIKVSIWNNPDFTRLGAGAQRLYFLLLSQGDLSLAGVVPLSERRWARCAPDTDVDELEKALDELEKARFVLVDRDTDEVWVRSFIRHDVNLTNGKLRRGMWTAWDAVHSPRLRAEIVTSLPSDVVDQAAAEHLTDNPIGHPTEQVTDDRILDLQEDSSLARASSASSSTSSSATPRATPNPNPTPAGLNDWINRRPTLRNLPNDDLDALTRAFAGAQAAGLTVRQITEAVDDGPLDSDDIRSPGKVAAARIRNATPRRLKAAR